MKFKTCVIKDVFIIEQSPFYDIRGSFRRHLCLNELNKMDINFKVSQANISVNSKKGTLRGFHYALEKTKEHKILTCISGSAWNVTIDLRKTSPTYLKVFETKLLAKNFSCIYIPSGCANAFLTLESNTNFHYYMNTFYDNEKVLGFRFDDPIFNINWPIKPLVISENDKVLPHLKI